MAQVERIEHSYTVLETAVLPLNYTRLLLYVSLKMERMARIELATTVWKTVVLPLNYIRINWSTHPVMLGGLEITNLLFY